MENVRKLLDDVKTKHDFKSDNALAAAIGVRRQRVSDYYKGDRTPDNFVCKRIAEMLGRPLAEIIAVVSMDAEKDESRREEWRDYFKRIGGLAASIMLLFFLAVTLIVTPTPAEASSSKVSQAQHFVLCKVVAVFKKAAAFVRHTISSAFPHFGFSS